MEDNKKKVAKRKRKSRTDAVTGGEHNWASHEGFYEGKTLDEVITEAAASKDSNPLSYSPLSKMDITSLLFSGYSNSLEVGKEVLEPQTTERSPTMLLMEKHKYVAWMIRLNTKVVAYA